MSEDSRKKKPWYRLRNVFLAIAFAIAAFFGWAFLEVWQVYTAGPNPTIDYRAKQRELAERYIQVSPLAADEAWQLFLDAAQLNNKVHLQIETDLIDNGFTPRSESDFGEIDFSYVRHGAILSHEIDRERSCLEQMQKQGVMKAIAAFVSKAPGLRPPLGEGPMIYDFVPELADARGLASALAAHMRIAATEGDFVQSIIDFEQVLAIAHTSWHQPGLLDHLVGMAIWALATEELRFELSEYEFDEPSCEKLLKILDGFELPPITLAIESEKLFIQDTIQWTFTDDGNNNGYMLATEDIGIIDPKNENRSLLEALASRFYFADRKTTVKLLDEFIQITSDLVGKTTIDRQDYNELDVFSESLYKQTKYRFLATLLPAFDKFLNRHSITQLQTQGTRIILAIELYQARYGILPKSLDDLVPSILEELPVDPITGGSLIYRKLESDPQNRQYLLYSTGLDEKDNGGDFSRDDSYEAVSYHPSGYDFLINQPRPSLEDY